jgi:hypothetical protein
MNKHKRSKGTLLGAITEDVQGLMAATTDMAGEKAGQDRERLSAAVESARELAGDVRGETIASAKMTGHMANDQICMTDDDLSADKKRHLAGGVKMAPLEESKQRKTQFRPSPDEVARRAYSIFENQGSRPGHDVQHWLDAENELQAEGSGG